MAENRAPRAGGRDFAGGMRQRRTRRKVCNFCANKVEAIDFMDEVTLKKYISENGKILPKRMTGTCAIHQRELTTAIKRARQVAILPYTVQ
ncbi:MAG: 30S ribosomal protein S18 [Eubacteriales bacterium]|jgi:small subunit ribosomal protein S18|nr:30S ribosomal protein S18 [Oscillospiraceae bacterium]MBQ1294869.1 30S ribosomal protein S18 [Clostridiales bacterium]MDO4421203.1 30S ribosomal protein S18 [Eubacteriales bacterium]MBQ1570625.1 30S ribosomal protein S18 [Clostridiales bacterium]MBQ5768230.1 30S ribosomal protein S18 [Clostridiales bacterium]